MNRQAQRDENERRYKEGSKRQLMELVENNCKTIMIGALEEFEKEFGFLWGQDQDKKSLTQEQIEFKKKYLKARNKVLTRGNNKIRGTISEMSNYTVRWDRHKTVFVIKDRD